jgi:hypothetical protein
MLWPTVYPWFFIHPEIEKSKGKIEVVKLNRKNNKKTDHQFKETLPYRNLQQHQILRAIGKAPSLVKIYERH